MAKSKNLIVFVLLLAAMPVAASFGQVTGDELMEQARERGRERAQVAEQDLWTKSVARRFENRIAETVSLFAELKKRHTSLTDWMASLLDNEDGKRLALDPMSGMQFLAYQEQPVFRLSDFDANEQLLVELQAFLRQKQSEAPVGFVPDAARVEQADDMYLWARDRLARVAEIEAWLKATLAEVDLDADVASSRTLRQAIDAYLAQRHELWVVNTTAGRLEAEREAAPKIEENARIVELERALFEAERLKREAMQQLEKERIDFERRIKEREVVLQEQLAAAERVYQERLATIARMDRIAEAERGRRDVEAEVKAREIDEDARRLDLVAKCRSAAVQRDLKPFLDHGVWQPGDRRPNERIEAGPMSYSQLVAFGALNPTVEGLQLLLGVANANSSEHAIHRGTLFAGKHMDTDRMKWSYPTSWSRLTRDQVRELDRIQKLLIELGPTLVEEGLLAP
jgi:hypothetical protein